MWERVCSHRVFMFGMKPVRLFCQYFWPEWVLYSPRLLVKIPSSFFDP